MSLDAIPIHVINTPPTESGLSGNALPLLREISELLRRLLETGETGTIDLSALPLTPADLDWLHEKLGEGEIAVTLQANGESTLNETACPGVWWVAHRNETWCGYIAVHRGGMGARTGEGASRGCGNRMGTS